jgi:gamma-glutamylputrescine oxidase
MPDLAREAALVADAFGYPGMRLVGPEEVRTMVGSARFAGGLFDADAGHLHPLNYCLGLAEAALAAGARIFEASRVTRLDAGAAPSLRTAGGLVRAGHVVLAGNAYMAGLAPAIERHILPIGTYILATQPLGEARARRLIPGDIAVSDSNFVLDYFRCSADHRLLFGGRVSYTGREPRDLAGVMRRRMLRTFPELTDVGVHSVWGGQVDITWNRMPDFGRIGPAVWYAQGFSGQGLALTTLAGALLAEAISGSMERFDLFARIPHRPFPGGLRLRRPLLALAMLWYRLRDLL